MSLKITKKKSVYYLKGEIIKTTVNSFIVYFKRKIKSKKKIVLNIGETKQIDKVGLNALKELINKATLKSKEVFITGNGCKEIYDDIQASKAV